MAADGAPALSRCGQDISDCLLHSALNRTPVAMVALQELECDLHLITRGYASPAQDLDLYWQKVAPTGP